MWLLMYTLYSKKSQDTLILDILFNMQRNTWILLKLLQNNKYIWPHIFQRKFYNDGTNSKLKKKNIWYHPVKINCTLWSITTTYHYVNSVQYWILYLVQLYWNSTYVHWGIMISFKKFFEKFQEIFTCIFIKPCSVLNLLKARFRRFEKIQ